MEGVGSVERDILYILVSGDQMAGTAIGDELKKYYGSDMSHGRIYPNLDRLVEKRLISRGQIDGRTNYYTLTDAGQAMIRDHREWKQQYIE